VFGRVAEPLLEAEFVEHRFYPSYLATIFLSIDS
jgi:hypothetical protein